MNNSDFLTISEIVYHPIIVLLLNLLMISSLCLISYQICRTKLKVSSLNLISTTLLLIFLIIILFQLIYYLNFYPRILGK